VHSRRIVRLYLSPAGKALDGDGQFTGRSNKGASLRLSVSDRPDPLGLGVVDRGKSLLALGEITG